MTQPLIALQIILNGQSLTTSGGDLLLNGTTISGGGGGGGLPTNAVLTTGDQIISGYKTFANFNIQGGSNLLVNGQAVFRLSDEVNTVINPINGGGRLYLSYDVGAGIVFGNGAAGIIGTIDTLGNLSMNGNVLIGTGGGNPYVSFAGTFGTGYVGVGLLGDNNLTFKGNGGVINFAQYNDQLIMQIGNGYSYFFTNVQPNTDNAYNLGQPGARWLGIYGSTISGKFYGDGSSLTGIGNTGTAAEISGLQSQTGNYATYAALNASGEALNASIAAFSGDLINFPVISNSISMSGEATYQMFTIPSGYMYLFDSFEFVFTTTGHYASGVTSPAAQIYQSGTDIVFYDFGVLPTGNYVGIGDRTVIQKPQNGMTGTVVIQLYNNATQNVSGKFIAHGTYVKL